MNKQPSYHGYPDLITHTAHKWETA